MAVPSYDKEQQQEQQRLQWATNEALRFFNLPITMMTPPPGTTTKEGEGEKNPHNTDDATTTSNTNVSSEREEEAMNRQSSSSSTSSSSPSNIETKSSFSSFHSASSDDYKIPPPPETWPQRPVLIRATPGTCTQIVKIRNYYYSDDNDDQEGGERRLQGGGSSSSVSSFWEENAAVPINNGSERPGDSIVVDFISKHFVGSLLVRIKGIPSVAARGGKKEETNLNNQQVDSNQSSSSSSSLNDNHNNYFDKRQRTFQAVIRGRFRSTNQLDMMDCVTGQTFRRPAGILPPQSIVRVFEALIHRLAPHNELTFGGDGGREQQQSSNSNSNSNDKDKDSRHHQQQHPYPRSLSPLITTAQTIQSSSSDNESSTTTVLHDGQFFYDSIFDFYKPNTIQVMEQDWQEPHPTDPTSIVNTTTNAGPQGQGQEKEAAGEGNNDPKENQKFRKQCFNKLLDERKQQHQHQQQLDGTENDDDNYVFDSDREYMFEFYEHMVVFDTPEMSLRLPLPSLLPSIQIPIAPCTDGQPIQIMSAVRRRKCNNDQDKEEEEQDDDDNNDNHDDDLEYLWNFEVWHESLYPYALQSSSS